MTKPNTKWKQGFYMGGTSFMLDAGEFYISYNPDPGASIFGAMFGADDGGDETALCDRRDGAFYILNGDYRATYEKLIGQGWEACKKFYDQQSAHADSSWSSRRAGEA